MTTRYFALVTSVCLWPILTSQPVQGGVVSFGSGVNQFSIDFVEIGSPGNPDDTTGTPNPVGSVGYAFQMGKYEISRSMILNANALGSLGITLGDMTSFGGNGSDRPAIGVSWFEAARFVNWLNTSQGYQAAYNFDSIGNFQLWTSTEAWQLDGENLFRHKNSHYWLPSLDELYKSAFFDPVSGLYYDYATGSNTVPTGVSSGTLAGTAVVGQLTSLGPADITQAGGLSPFGTMGQGGNVMEWEETEIDLLNNGPSSPRGVRVGVWNSVAAQTSSSFRSVAGPTGEILGVGFRVATLSEPAAVPEPSSIAMWLIGLAGLRLLHRRCAPG